MATYLVVKNGSNIKSYECKTTHNSGTYLKVNKGAYLDLATNTATGTQARVKFNNTKTYRILQKTTTNVDKTVTTGYSGISTSNSQYYIGYLATNYYLHDYAESICMKTLGGYIATFTRANSSVPSMSIYSSESITDSKEYTRSSTFTHLTMQWITHPILYSVSSESTTMNSSYRETVTANTTWSETLQRILWAIKASTITSITNTGTYYSVSAKTSSVVSSNSFRNTIFQYNYFIFYWKFL